MGAGWVMAEDWSKIRRAPQPLGAAHIGERFTLITTTEQVGRAMLHVANAGEPQRYFEMADIYRV